MLLLLRALCEGATDFAGPQNDFSKNLDKNILDKTSICTLAANDFGRNGYNNFDKGSQLSMILITVVKRTGNFDKNDVKTNKTCDKTELQRFAHSF